MGHAALRHVSHQRGYLSGSDLARIGGIYRSWGLAVAYTLTPESLAKALVEARRHRGGNTLLPLPSGIGQVRFVVDTTIDEWVAAQRWLSNAGRAPEGAVMAGLA